jgi:hypothetical protein
MKNWGAGCETFNTNLTDCTDYTNFFSLIMLITLITRINANYKQATVTPITHHSSPITGVSTLFLRQPNRFTKLLILQHILY